MPSRSAIKRRRHTLVLAYKNKCGICGKEIKGESPTIDHLIPKALGGNGELSNLQLAHKKCNSRKKALLISPVITVSVEIKIRIRKNLINKKQKVGV